MGRAQRVSIRSLGWDGQLTIDGITSIPFNFGVQGIVEVRQHSGHDYVNCLLCMGVLILVHI